MVVGETLGVDYSVWASYFREVRKSFSPIGDQAEFFYVELQVDVDKREASEEIGWSLVQELFDNLGIMGSNIIKPKLVCFIVDC